MRWILPAGLVVALTAAAARGNMLVNGNFDTLLNPTLPENLVYASPTVNSNALTGWSITQGTIDVVPAAYFQSSIGSYAVDLVGTPGLGSIRQSISTINGNNYGLTFDLAFNPENIHGEQTSIKRLLVEVLAADNTTVLATQVWTGTTGTRTNLNMQFSSQSLQFEATGTTSTIVFTALESLSLPTGITGANSYCGPVIDNVDLLDLGAAPPVPEPTSLGVLGVGVLALLSRRRARKPV